jgi:ADP-heptose:LPS heptosyltransferase
MKILFIGPTRIGDAVLSSGLIRHLGETYPQAAITVACGAVAAPLYAGVPNLDRVIPIVKKPAAAHWFDVWRAVVGTRWALVVDLRRSIIPWTVWTSRRSISGPAADADEHRVVSLARTLGLAKTPPAPCLWTLDAHRARAEHLIPDGGPVLAVAPTANWRGKTWRAERFVELIERLTDGGPGADAILPDARVAILGGPGEAPAAAPVIDAVPADRRIDLVGTEDLPTVAACLKRCALFVGNDSGLMHMAAAAEIPTVGLFGPSRPENYRPWGDLAVAVRTEKAYGDLVGGPGYDHRNTDTLMDSLSVDSVVAATVGLWRQHQQIAVQ